MRTKKPISSNVAWIRDQMHGHHLSQSEMAQAIGIDPPAMSRVLSGYRQLKAEELDAAKAFLAVRNAASSNILLREMGKRMLTAEQLGVSSQLGEETILERMASADGSMSEREATYIEAGMQIPAGSLSARLRRPHISPTDPISLPIYLPPQFLGDGWYRQNSEIGGHRTIVLDPPLHPTQSYGFFVGDDELAPRLELGDVAVVDPSRPMSRNSLAVARQGDKLIIGRIDSLSRSKVVLNVPNRGQVEVKPDELHPIVAVVFW